MDKLTMAHEYAVKNLDDRVVDVKEYAAWCWSLADAMQAEANKCINTDRPDVLKGTESSQLGSEPKPLLEPTPKPKQHACNCAHWKNSSFFMGDTFTCKDCGGSVTI